MKIIFLDVDGVLNSKDTIANGVHLDPHKVMLVNQLVEETDADVVISSTWRRMYSLEDLSHILHLVGFKRSDKIKGTTPLGHHGFCSRGEEIQSVLDANNVDSYVIFDDSNDMNESQKDNFIRTNINVGLKHSDIIKAKKILMK